MKKALSIFLLLVCINCSKEELFSSEARHDLWLLHEGAELPIIVEGNTESKIFLILLHGGPGGSAQDFNAGNKPFSDQLEKDYALVYYDQRNSGLARGEWDEEKLTIEQHIEDLDKVIDLLSHKYGAEIKIFLSGHSWGGYLGTAYILDPLRQSKVKSWININGNTHRHLRNIHNMNQIINIAEEQITRDVNLDAWSLLLDDIKAEMDKNIAAYNSETERAVNTLKVRAERLISQDRLLAFNSSSINPSLYFDNYDPFLMLANDRKGRLIEQMYSFDKTIEVSLSSVELPVLSIYGKYDVTTALQQGDYLLENISTNEMDKKMVVLSKSGHSTMANEPLALAEEIKDWIEKYK